jgi:hypothetical protein
MQHALVIGQVMVVVFLALHDWVPLGKLNNVAGLRAVDTINSLVFSTAFSTMRVWHSSGVVDSLSRHS